ncbi:MAG: NADH-quinone oxidoreductase subunit L [Rhodospirillales bacterium 20-60-12]|nr:MAG: NADH-quinone oxidoreductase subunit L [Rhodospirillales bacterium 20-60-12]HQT66506.1 NADH-quinone oxidoreductase subunit L [Acetobacteraceae bacterium]
MDHWLSLVPALPLFSAALLGVAGGRMSERMAGAIGSISIGLAAIISCGILAQFLAAPPAQHLLAVSWWHWIDIDGFRASFGLYLDPLSLLMMVVVTVIGFLIHVFSSEYMAEEAGYSRYFAYLNLFVAAMLLLILADNMLVLFVGWEGVGVCSYLLVGFWYQDPANGVAARKSFIVTRIADTAMIIGLVIMALQLGTLHIQPALQQATTIWHVGGAMPSLVCALLLIGGLGKSAQLPFQAWLPDAMAGPTPVSALIHAATMVTAGVYLIVRTHVLFELAPVVMLSTACIGAATLLLASLAAIVQSDIKRVLAYSTISQIGYMFLAVGIGAWSAAMFHFLTHAVFKALLFLSAGAIASRLHHEQNMFRMGGLRREIPLAFWCFLIGSMSLAALPVISAGFFSKDMILGAVWQVPHAGQLLWLAGIICAIITSTYIFRAVFLVFFGPLKTEISGHYGLRMTVPLVLLAAGALGAGWLETPDYLGGATHLSAFLASAVGGVVAGSPGWAIIAAGMLAPLLGLAVAFALFKAGFWQRQSEVQPSVLRRFMAGGFGFDGLYNVTFVKPFFVLSAVLRDDPVDRLFDSLARVARQLHRSLRHTQTGQLRRYAGWIAAGSLATLAVMVFS